MRAFGHPTAKRTVCYSNSSLIARLDMGSLKRTDLVTGVATCERYIAKCNGKKRFKGTAALKGTQCLGLIVLSTLTSTVVLVSPPTENHYNPWFPSQSLRLYPWRYAAKIVLIGEEATMEVRDPISQVPEAPPDQWEVSNFKKGFGGAFPWPGVPAACYLEADLAITDLYASLEWNDRWPDADLIPAIRYVRQSKRLELPCIWRAVLPTGM